MIDFTEKVIGIFNKLFFYLIMIFKISYFYEQAYFKSFKFK